MASIFWLLIFIVLLVIEIVTLGLTTIWFCGGAIIAFIASLLGADFNIQILLFLSISIILFVFIRPLAAKYINKNTVKTNIDSIAGKQARITETVDNLHATGTAFFDGKEWTARAEDDDMIIQPETIVTVVSVKGVKLIVRTIKEDEA